MLRRATLKRLDPERISVRAWDMSKPGTPRHDRDTQTQSADNDEIAMWYLHCGAAHFLHVDGLEAEPQRT